MKSIVAAVLLCIATSLNGNPTTESQQMIVALADDWAATTGYLQRFERATCNEQWHSVGEKIAVSFGKNGLGWGTGLHDKHLLGDTLFANGPRVVEGSRRSPVGVFALTIAFGKAGTSEPDARTIKLPYVQITPHIWGVDDPKSKYYNRIVDDQVVDKDWDSAEDMHRYMCEKVYEFGIHIEHNYATPIPGGGSCFFIHVHRRPGAPTFGCTAFAREQVKEVLDWLDPNKKPVLAQFPVAVFTALKEPWGLPDFDHTPI